MKRSLIFFISILAFFQGVYASEIDSLKAILQNEKNDSNRYQIYSELIVAFSKFDDQKSDSVAEVFFQEAKTKKDFSAQANALDIRGEINRRLGNYSNAIKYLEDGLMVKKALNEPKEVAISYNKLGKVYANKGDYDLSVENFINALKIMEEIGDKEGQAFYLNNIGILYDMQGIYDKALAYYEKSMNLKKELNDEEGYSATLNNVAIVYFNQELYEKSLEAHKKALDLKKKFGNQRHIARSYNNVGYAFIYLEQYDSALYMLNKALSIRKTLKNQRDYATTLNNIAQVHFKKKEYKIALEKTDESLEIANEIKSKVLIKSAELLRSQIYEQLGDYKNSLKSYQNYSSIKDSILDQEKSEIIAEMETKYQTEKKEKELQEATFQLKIKGQEIEKKRFQRNSFIIIAVVLVVLISVLFFSYNQKRRINTLLKAQNILMEKANISLKNENEIMETELSDKTQQLEQVFKENKELELPPELLTLSKREMEVLSFLALGWTDQQIADKLFISKATAKTHLRRIYSKLLVKGRAEAVNVAHRYKIVGK